MKKIINSVRSRIKKIKPSILAGKSESGFTLIELLVVIGIIAVLATIGTISFSGARAKARDAKRQADISQMQSLIEIEAASAMDGEYPDASDADLPAEIKLTPPAATDAYCYYVDNTNFDDYVLAVIGVETTDLADSTAGSADDSFSFDDGSYNGIKLGGNGTCPTGVDVNNKFNCNPTPDNVHCVTGSKSL